MRLYRHRANDLADVRALPPGLGVELDLRDQGADVIVTHDPFTTGPTFEAWLEASGPRPLICNVKCEGIEARVLATAKAHGVDDLFLLDCTVPAMVKLRRAGERRFAVRWSEVEPIESVLAWAGAAEWVWVDCFSRWPGTDAEWARVAETFRICLVSPELQAHGFESISRFRKALGDRRFDAVCTKRPEAWSD